MTLNQKNYFGTLLTFQFNKNNILWDKFMQMVSRLASASYIQIVL
jgi:hypothetical protein